MVDRRALTRQYKESERPIGVFRVHNVAANKSLLGSSKNVLGRLNRHRFDLEMGSHAHRELQADWLDLGESAFCFETLDLINAPVDDPSWDPAEDLAELEAMWRERIIAEGGALYDE